MIVKLLAYLYQILNFFSEELGEIKWGCDAFLGNLLCWYFANFPMGICITGGTGTGKSKRLLLMLLGVLFRYRYTQNWRHKWAALIIDPKITFAKILADLPFPSFTDVWVLDEKAHYPMNLLRSNLPSQKIAEFLSECRYAGAALVKSSGSMFYETIAISMISYLIDLARLTNTQSLAYVDGMLEALMCGGTLSSTNPVAKNALARITAIMSGSPKEVAAILASVDHILEPFRRSPWRETFYQDGPFLLSEARDKGRIVVCLFTPSTPHLTSGLFLLKALWFHVIMERLNRDFCGNKERLCFFIADEFQKVARPGSESAFFDVRREARGAPIVAFQQLSQLIDVLGPTETETVLGLLSIKIALRNPDPATNEYYSKLGGYIHVWVESKTTSSTPSGWSFTGHSTTGSWVLMPRIPAQFFFDLPDGDAVVFQAGKKPFYAWFGGIYMFRQDEKVWRKKHWPTRPNLSHSRWFLR